MKMDLDPVGELAGARPVAQHGEALFASDDSGEDRSEAIASWRRDLARALTEELSSLLTGEKPLVTVGEPQFLPGAKILSQIGPLAANCLLDCGPGAEKLLFSVDFGTAIALTDRSFGGTGEADSKPPETLPRSAGLLIEQVATLAARALASAAAGEQRQGDSTAKTRVVASSDTASRLDAIGPLKPCMLLAIEIAVGSAGYETLLAMNTEVFDALVPGGAGTARFRADRGSADSAPERAAIRGPLSEIPLTIEAVLAEFELSLSRLDRLAPGDSFALSVAREIPLRLGSAIIAHGSLGTLEDRLALRITDISPRNPLREIAS